MSLLGRWVEVDLLSSHPGTEDPPPRRDPVESVL